MVLTSRQIFDFFMHGAEKVIENKEVLNKINVFPVQDGDTGSNLASMMRTIIHQSENRGTVKETLASVADAALYGARGNSGIIFAQYLTGLSESIVDGTTVSIKQYADASQNAVKYAYDAVEKPVEGTMLSVMREWGMALIKECEQKDVIEDIFKSAVQYTRIALKKTKYQLEILKKENVVDSGAQGFTFFVEGAFYYIQNGYSLEEKDEILKLKEFHFNPLEEIHTEVDEYRYCTECLLVGEEIDIKKIKEKLSNFGGSFIVAGNKKKCRIHIHTDEPEKIFEFLYKEGSIVFQKIDDMFKQTEVVNHRKSDIALLTDSIADLPIEIIDNKQIHIVHMDILYKDICYKDKLTIKPTTLLNLSKEDDALPTSSQPSPKQIEEIIDYLSSYYKSLIVITVSSALSGTYNDFKKIAKTFDLKGFNVTVVDSKQNSGAQGLLVKKCAEYIENGLTIEKITKKIQNNIEKSKILVQVRTLDNMIKSGRLSTTMGKIGKKIGLKPIVTLDFEGKGALDSIAFSLKKSNINLVKHIKKVMKKNKLEEYNIVHVNNIEDAEKLAEVMTKVIGFPPVYITETSSVVAVGAGEGAIAISYLYK